MATAKKKPTAAQLAARKLFAQRAKAGTLKKNSARKVARKTVVKKNPVRKSAVKKAVVRKNSVHVLKSSSSYGKKSRKYKYYIYTTTSNEILATFERLDLAKEYAQAKADSSGVGVVIEKR